LKDVDAVYKLTNTAWVLKGTNLAFEWSILAGTVHSTSGPLNNPTTFYDKFGFMYKKVLIFSFT
jgi:hypothetical protein